MRGKHALLVSLRAFGTALLIIMSFLETVDSKKVHMRRQNNNSKIFICKHIDTRCLSSSVICRLLIFTFVDIGFAVFLFCLFLMAGWCAREFCPRGPIFTPLELDEIRLDRLDDIESTLQTSISTLKVSVLTISN